MHSLHTRQSERQSCPVSHALCRDFEFFEMVSGSFEMSAEAGVLSMRSQNQVDKISVIRFFMYYTTQGREFFLIKVSAQGMKKNPLNIPTN